jgi:hypothetical protein
MLVRCRHAAALVAAVLPGRLTAQPPQPAAPPAAAPPSMWARDSARAAWLAEHGRAVRRPHAVLVAPADSVPEAWQQALADTLDRGVASVRRLIGGPYAWQRIAGRPATPLTFLLSPERFAGHGTGRDTLVFSLPFARAGAAEFLREASHELLVPTCAAARPCYPSPWERPDTMSAEAMAAARTRFPNWLFWYGIAGYLAHRAADAEGIREPTRFDGGLAGADSVCAARAPAHPRRAEVLRRVGTPGGSISEVRAPDRREIALLWYPCTLSMTKFLVDRVGLRQVVLLFPAVRAGTWEREIERATGEPLPELRRRWLAHLGLAEP